ncbi:4-hydroxybenzoate polyprenyltransferase, mitochondrial [Gracilariopsis chorda]|uniref:4-hydroxybenzoate polyprenyltransferase, mitochondrial n=1 Tax=Gracilariopsis chorda TaxID=448386 RepID=A0A2V3IX12_9FLOR|nr:4-hydroxybenzoate polyprenyltransferase, mitochondrial [Gracilariopsis chorda]|eukprot:PXF46605.1 4-hydroxybenzoate polyprenyltransferase, mitochondrial [Gracilariopsis chorda]
MLRSLCSAPQIDSPKRTQQSPSLLSNLQSLHNRANAIYTRVSQNSYARLMRLDKPIGTHLLFLPCAWSISLHADLPQMLYLLPIFYAGATVMRGAGCTINDIWDVDIDRKVARTRTRPIAAGDVSVSRAFVFLGAQLMSALAILTRLNQSSFLVASLSVLPVLFYPLAKRRTPYPQAVLGMTMNWGALLGCTAVAGSITLPASMLYASGVCWTMVYDTVYAHQDKGDDKFLGIGSTALQFGERTKPMLAAFMAGQAAFLMAAGAAAELGTGYYMGITAAMIHGGYHLNKVDLSNKKECMDAFVSNQRTGALLWASILGGRLF